MDQKTIRYSPSPDNQAYLIDKQAEYVKDKPYVGLHRIVDILISKIRKIEKKEK